MFDQQRRVRLTGMLPRCYYDHFLSMYITLLCIFAHFSVGGLLYLLADVGGRFFANDDLGHLVVTHSIGDSLHLEKDIFFDRQILQFFYFVDQPRVRIRNITRYRYKLLISLKLDFEG